LLLPLALIPGVSGLGFPFSLPRGGTSGLDRDALDKGGIWGGGGLEFRRVILTDGSNANDNNA
jgi:hypothetical protein